LTWVGVRPVAALFVGVLCALPPAARAQDLVDDPFAAAVSGEWEGSGEYGGDTLMLARSWTTELGGQFLRADMRVRMANGRSFGALMYWKRVAPDVYEIVWMDATGRRQILQATRDPESGLVWTTYLDTFTEGEAEWRTWEFESLGADSYLERLYRLVGDRREPLTVFSFERASRKPGDGGSD
jgi:hypothetical protein